MPASSEPDFIGVVVAAGRSTRLGGPRPKQFEQLDGRTVLERSVRALADRPSVRGVIVVLPRSDVAGASGREARVWPGVLGVIAGGRARSDSVLAGVQAARSARYVLVHDAARPLAGPALVDSVIEATRRHGAAVPGLAVPDTVKRIDRSGFAADTLDRDELRLAQTPQGARTDWLLEALQRAAETGTDVTDESAALEGTGRRVAVVAGDPSNRKITNMEDLEEMRGHLSGGSELRVGSGFDVHRVDAERPLVLGGVTFDGEPGLSGHSDADVVLHAAMDALLGAAGLGDIGGLFPPDDPRFAGAASSGLAKEVARRIAEAGYGVVNLDLTLLAERPRIKDRAGEMRESIGRCFGIDADRVGLKATTLERLGALGRREGIGCQAVALIRRS